MKTSSLVAIVASTVVLGLLFDASFGGYGQWIANALVFAVFGYVVWRSEAREARQLLLCAAIALLGEILLCFFWGLYTYRWGNLPLFVPPGHALLFLAGSRLGPLVRSSFPGIVLAAGTISTLGLVLLWGLEADLLWFGLFVAVFFIGRERKVYSVMLPMALLLELLGTAVGAWRWAPEVPFLGLTSGNPPLAAGAFYCVLDLLVFAAARWLTRATQSTRPTLAKVDYRQASDWLPATDKPSAFIARGPISTATIRSAPIPSAPIPSAPIPSATIQRVAAETPRPAPLAPMKHRVG